MDAASPCDLGVRPRRPFGIGEQGLHGAAFVEVRAAHAVGGVRADRVPRERWGVNRGKGAATV
jgi:hypothetical protein